MKTMTIDPRDQRDRCVSVKGDKLKTNTETAVEANKPGALSDGGGHVMGVLLGTWHEPPKH